MVIFSYRCNVPTPLEEVSNVYKQKLSQLAICQRHPGSVYFDLALFFTYETLGKLIRIRLVETKGRVGVGR